MVKIKVIVKAKVVIIILKLLVMVLDNKMLPFVHAFRINFHFYLVHVQKLAIFGGFKTLQIVDMMWQSILITISLLWGWGGS